ncbi:MAG TPA: GNVR domain-containing protein [Steroidobacteraceae bacterium]|jgi:uncharacterized protein involved in exopolysaccharide biosynthesis|nr:GNVR domain-containing protein [Steroidobacteraceae bacterium]
MAKETDIDFVALFWTAWDQKYLVLSVSLLCGLLAAAIALTATPLFRAQVVVTEVHDTGLGAGGGLMGELGGLASIAGLNLDMNGPGAERAAVLESRGLVDAFVARYDLTPLINGDAKGKNSRWLAVERFRKNVLDLHEDKIKGTTTVTFDWKDPVVAARWANDFVALANELLRARAIAESTRNIEFLNQQLTKTNQVEIQQAIYRLIEGETKQLMLAHGRLEYAFTIVDPAVVPEVRVSPRRTLMVISGLFIGGLLGAIAAWIRQSARRRRALAPTN